MEQVDIWYLTDSGNGKRLAQSIKDLGLRITLVTDKDFTRCEISSNSINIFVVDIADRELSDIMALTRDDTRIQPFLKFIILKKNQIRQAMDSSMNMLHMEFISRPVIKREFILLLEKSIVVERYREIMRYISKDAEDRIEAFESLLNINRRDFFESEKEKEAFERIITYEKHLMSEQGKLNRAIQEFTYLRQREIFHMKDRIKAEEMLADLRRKELLDANSVIHAQEALIDFSTKELHDANKIFNAAERAAELGRLEAIRLHEELEKEKEKSSALSGELKALQEELRSMRRKS